VISTCIYAPRRFRQKQTTTATATATMVPSEVNRTTNPPPDNERYARVIKPQVCRIITGIQISVLSTTPPPPPRKKVGGGMLRRFYLNIAYLKSNRRQGRVL